MATDPKLYSVELGQRTCRTIMRNLLELRNRTTDQNVIQRDPDTNCMLYTGRVSRDGHWQIQRRPRYRTRASTRTGSNQHAAFYVHRIAYVALHNRDIVNTASHLCGRGNCVNAYHIYDEAIRPNIARINCLGTIICSHHNRLLATLCQHTPRCIKKPIQAERCCLTIENEPSADSEASTSSEPSLTSPYDDFLHSSQDPPPSDDQWLQSSQEFFDSEFEIVSSDSGSQSSTPRPESRRPLPPWKEKDFAEESESDASSDYMEEDQPRSPSESSSFDDSLSHESGLTGLSRESL